MYGYPHIYVLVVSIVGTVLSKHKFSDSSSQSQDAAFVVTHLCHSTLAYHVLAKFHTELVTQTNGGRGRKERQIESGGIDGFGE